MRDFILYLEISELKPTDMGTRCLYQCESDE